MYKVLLGHMEPPDDVIPDFMHEELSGVGNAAQQAMERGRFLRVRLQCCPQHWDVGWLARHTWGRQCIESVCMDVHTQAVGCVTTDGESQQKPVLNACLDHGFV